MRILASYIERVAEVILRNADDYKYSYDPEHRNKPEWRAFETERGWSNDPKDDPSNKQNVPHGTNYPYELTEEDNEYFEAVRESSKTGDVSIVQKMVDDIANYSFFRSKVRRGRPSRLIKLQHDTSKKFNQFKLGGDNPDLSGKAIWMGVSGTKLKAAHNVKQNDTSRISLKLYANIKNPLVLDSEELVTWAVDRYLTDESDWMKQEFPLLLSDITIEKIKLDGYDGIVLDKIEDRNFLLKEIKMHVENAKRLGNSLQTDMSEDDKMEVIAFYPSQVKSEDPIVKDDQGNIIPPSQRFNPQSNDIRF